MDLRGIVAVTDYTWYQNLSQRSKHWDEVNFWSPSAHVGYRAPEFTPFLFKLKAPYNTIAGFGFFVRFTTLPEWLAWECFREGNGFSSLEAMRQQLSKLRRVNQSTVHPQTIGCSVLVDAVFFPSDEWIEQPADWSPSIQRSKNYDLTKGEGLRIWQECVMRLEQRPVLSTVDADTGHDLPSVYGEPALYRPRIGQGAFRVAVTEAYGRACAATGEHSLPALDAAHIKPLSRNGTHNVHNGLLLRADLHRLFDLGYVTVSADHVIEVSRRLHDDYENGRTYYPLHGTKIEVPQRLLDRPDPGLLRWHNESVYLG